MQRCAKWILNCFVSEVSREGAQNYKNLSLLSIFRRLGLFHQVFGQVKVWLMFDWYIIIRMSHVVACLTVFILFYEQGWEGGVFKLLKNNHFLLFLDAWILFSEFFGQVKECLILQFA